MDDAQQKEQLAEYWQKWQENGMIKWKKANPDGTFEDFIQVRNAAIAITSASPSHFCAQYSCPENIELGEDGQVQWLDDRLNGTLFSASDRVNGAIS